MSSVLIIDDDADVADTIQACIQAAGYTSYLAETGERGLELCQLLQPDIIILDLMLTARRGKLDEIWGLATGADDYMTKPFDSDLLIARLRALLRRELRHSENAVGADAALIRHQYLRLHQTHRHCSVRASLTDDWVDLVLSALEFDLLANLARQQVRAI